MTLLKGKRALICGIASRHSLGYAIATAMKKAGADIAITYQNEALYHRIKPLLNHLDATFSYHCDVTQDTDIDILFIRLKQHWDTFDILVHSLAYAPKEALMGDYLNTTREAFRAAHEVSSYSFTALASRAQAMLGKNSALLTLSYLGSTHVVPYYNVMGLAKASLEASVRYLASSLGPSVRVNAISAGPISTIASSAIKNFKKVLALHKEKSPLRACTTSTEVANTAVCLCSDWMLGVSGEVIHVDGGLHAISPLT